MVSGVLRVAVVAALMSSVAAQAELITYSAVLAGSAEAPPNASPGTGSATVQIDTVAHTMRVQVSFADLLGITTASHIHCCTAVPGAGTAGVATVTPSFTGFPGGVSSGTYDHLFDLTAVAGTWNNTFVNANGGVSGAEAMLLNGLDSGKAYLNVHTNLFPGGEIRGFLNQVPEPVGVMLVMLGLGALALTRASRHA